MMRPNQTKYRKHRKIRVKGIAQRSNRINFGSFGLKAMEGGLLTGRQLEAARISLNRKLKESWANLDHVLSPTPSECQTF